MLTLKLGARFRLLKQLQVLGHLAACMECIAPFWLELQSWPGRHAQLSSLHQWLGKKAEHTYYCERVHPSWNHVKPKQLILLNVSYIVDKVLCQFQGEKHVVFLVILAVARRVVWMTQKKGFYDGANFSHRDLILFFRHQLRVKIRCDRKHLDRITLDGRWVHAVSLVMQKGATLEPPFPPHGDYGPDPLEPHPW